MSLYSILLRVAASRIVDTLTENSPFAVSLMLQVSLTYPTSSRTIANEYLPRQAAEMAELWWGDNNILDGEGHLCYCHTILPRKTP